MERSTLSQYGLILVTVLIASALLLVFTPLGHDITNGISDIAEGVISGMYVEKTPDDDRNRPTIGRWENQDVIQTVKLNFIYEDGKTARQSEIVDVKYGTEFSFDDLIPQIEGYSATNTPAPQVITRDIEYTVVFKPVQFTIEYNTNGGTIAQGKAVKYSFGEKVILPYQVTKPGYKFVGWYEDAELNGLPIKEIEADRKGNVILYAKYEQNKYKITYMSKGKDVTKEVKKLGGVDSVVYGETFPIPTLETNGNEYFSGWFLTKDYKGAASTYTPSDIETDIVYYAKWSDAGYRINFILNGGEPVNPYNWPTSYHRGSSVTLPNVHRTGCDFAGWYETEHFTGSRKYTIGDTETGDKTYYAKWTPALYEIEYDTVGGTIMESNYATTYKYFSYQVTPVISGYPVMFPTNVIKPTNKFVGWMNEKTGEMIQGTQEGQHGNLRLRAVYEDEVYQLIMNGNGGTFTDGQTVVSKYLSIGKEYGTLQTPTRKGYSFAGYYSSADNKDNKIDSADIFNPTDDNREINVYAHWDAVSYKITYNTNNGRLPSTGGYATTYTIEGLDNNRLPIPQKDHSTFDGWYFDNDYQNKANGIPAGKIGDITLHAKWKDKIYTIDYDTKDGTLAGKYPTTYTYGSSVRLPIPTKIGYTFQGWTIEGSSGNVPFLVLPKDTSGNIKLIANWAAETVNVNLHLVDINGNEVMKEGVACIITQPYEFGKTYTLDSNVLTSAIGIDDTYYNEMKTFTVNKDILNTTTGTYDVNVITLPYRFITIKAVNDIGSELNTVYQEDNIIKFKQNKDAIPSQYRDNASLYENIDMSGYIIFSPSSSLTYANTISITSIDNEFSNIKTVNDINNMLNQELGGNTITTKTYTLFVHYKETSYTVTFENKTTTPKTTISKYSIATEVPTTYYPSSELMLPNLERACYTFNGWKAETEESGKEINVLKRTVLVNATDNSSKYFVDGLPDNTKIEISYIAQLKDNAENIIITAQWAQKDVTNACHKFEITNEATCVKDGTKQCRICGITTSVPKTGHKLSDKCIRISEVSPTPYISGVYIYDSATTHTVYDDTYHVYKCSLCNGYVAKQHNLTADDSNYSTGYHTIVCKDCNYNRKEEHAKQNYVSVDSKHHSFTCTICKKEIKEIHEFENNECKYCHFEMPQNPIPSGGIYKKTDGTELTGGQSFPQTPSAGDTYEYGDYVYTYNKGSYYGTEWSVVVKENTKTEYGEILSEIVGKPVTHMSQAFENCTSLTTAPTIPNSVTNMYSTFRGCTSLTTAPTIPNSVTNMNRTFRGCYSLTTAPTIPNSVTSMDQTFYDCKSLTTAPTIPSSVTHIGCTFSGCISLTTAPTIPNSVTNMFSTFDGCKSLISAPIIPQNVTDIRQLFSGCTSLKTYAGSTDSDGDFSNYTIPSGVTNMRLTFGTCQLLNTAPVIPNSVTDMEYTFYSCTSLTTAPVIPSNVTNMYGTFQNCTSLTTAPAIPNSVTDMSYTFYRCTSLTGTIGINANPTNYRDCFYDTVKPIQIYGKSTKLNELAETDNNGNVTVLTTIKGDKISENYKAKDGDVVDAGEYRYDYKASQSGWSVKVRNTQKTSYNEIIQEIGGKPVTDMAWTFSRCSSLTTAPKIPSSVTNMDHTFFGCTSLTTPPDMSNANGVTNMESTFFNCTSLTTAPTIPNSVTNMESTFGWCTSLTTAPKIPSRITNMQGTFRNCTSLTTAPAIPNNVTNMSFTFADCTSLTTAPAIPNSVMNMTFTFNGCTSLTGTIEVNANPTSYGKCLKSTRITGITGSCSQATKDALMKTK